MTFKPLDADSISDDRALCSHVPVILEANVRNTFTTHHEGGSLVWRADSSTGDYAAYSTHPDYFYAFPFVVPIYEGAETLTIDVVADVAFGGEPDTTDAVEVALRVGTTVGATSTLGVGTDQSFQLTCDAPSDVTGYARCALLIRSLSGEREGLLEVESVQLSSYFTEGVYETGSTPSGLDDGRTHYHGVADDASFVESGDFYQDVHISKVRKSTKYLWTWPVPAEGAFLFDPDETANTNMDIYDLGTIAPHSLAWRWSSTATRDDLAEIYSAAQKVRAGGVQLIASRAASMYRARRKTFSVLPPQDDAPLALGVDTTASGGQIGGALVTVDEGRPGFDVILVAISRYPGEATSRATVTVTQYDDTNTSLQADTFAWNFEPTDYVDSTAYAFPSRFLRDGGSLARWNVAVRNSAEHGHGDLMFAGEILPRIIGGERDAVGFRRFPVAWDPTLSTGDTVRVVVEVDDRVHVWNCTIAERAQ